MSDYWSTARMMLQRPHANFPRDRRWWPLNGLYHCLTWMVFWAPRLYFLHRVQYVLYWLNQGREGSRWWCPVPGDQVTSCMGAGQMCVVESVDIDDHSAQLRRLDGELVTSPWVCLELEASVPAK